MSASSCQLQNNHAGIHRTDLLFFIFVFKIQAVKVKKYSGDLVEFDINKLRNSLKNTKASEPLIESILKEVSERMYDGISTKQIYSLAFGMLKPKKNAIASRYKLKHAIMELGPSGYPFEKYVAAILEAQGFKAETGVQVNGHCLSHEVDVIATNTHKQYMVECKYHNTQGRVNDVKVPLYIRSRFVDINTQHKHVNGHTAIFQECWIFTNTRFSTDALAYARCMDIKVVSWDYPNGGGLKDIINHAHLFPVTALMSLTKAEKSVLLEHGLVLCKEILEKPELLKLIKIDAQRQTRVLKDCRDLCCD